MAGIKSKLTADKRIKLIRCASLPRLPALASILHGAHSHSQCGNGNVPATSSLATFKQKWKANANICRMLCIQRSHRVVALVTAHRARSQTMCVCVCVYRRGYGTSIYLYFAVRQAVECKLTFILGEMCMWRRCIGNCTKQSSRWYDYTDDMIWICNALRNSV